MNLIFLQFFSSLKERDELDVIIPDLLTEAGLRVFSRPSKGTSQAGVDVAAFGKLGDDGEEKVYLLSIKSGDLTKTNWDIGQQALRPSLNEILDDYIPNRLPMEYRDFPKVICLCVGGEIRENIRPSLAGYQKELAKRQDDVSLQEWDGNRLTELTSIYLLHQDLLPDKFRNVFRKSLAMIDDPETTSNYFTYLMSLLIREPANTIKKAQKVLRQINMCLWIHFSWARDANNLEGSYLAAEAALLYGWELTKQHHNADNNSRKKLFDTHLDLLQSYITITKAYVEKVVPHTYVQHSLSLQVNSKSSLDVSLKLFEILGRISLAGIWVNWFASLTKDKSADYQQKLVESQEAAKSAIIALIENNPILNSPIKDDHLIDILLTLIFFKLNFPNENIEGWITEILARTEFSLSRKQNYPSIYQDYEKLLKYLIPNRQQDFERATAASTLLPYIAIWSKCSNWAPQLDRISSIQENLLQHCNFQTWYPNSDSEDHIYLATANHGFHLSNIYVSGESNRSLNNAIEETQESNFFENLSAMRFGFWPLLLVASRFHRWPLPVQFITTLFPRNLEETA